jgi:predicted MPP superfamily phosphohydrolase
VPGRVALTLAGHTHGGQIRLPLVPPVWAPSEYGARFAYGRIVEQGRHMIVSGGLGCSKVCRCGWACRRKSCASN